ncbi:MAG: hypothetical protein Edafosvirus1_89 [Edafosvirus sp.]|uniref:Uncharacterized protein n=1 Tax=Edafosvirus sp. TaxID=2487765 RepID=A0A3G4ZS90_9VIRU|nr:MAG: hypothetical protein Edafosvirus1_89 [Edafosvirus sp.]
MCKIYQQIIDEKEKRIQNKDKIITKLKQKKEKNK